MVNDDLEWAVAVRWVLYVGTEHLRPSSQGATVADQINTTVEPAAASAAGKTGTRASL